MTQDIDIELSDAEQISLLKDTEDRETSSSAEYELLKPTAVGKLL